MTTAGRIRHRVASAPAGSFFRPYEFEGVAGAIETALSRLASEGTLTRVRRGLYWKGVNSRFGSGWPGARDIAMELAGDKGNGPTGWSASHFLGLTTQVPPVADMTVVGRHAPKAPSGVRFHTRANLDRLKLGFYEIALIEVLRDWPLTTDADWPTLLATVKELGDKGLINLKRVVKGSRSEPPKVRNLVHSIAA
jgi:hypothetical protein